MSTQMSMNLATDSQDHHSTKLTSMGWAAICGGAILFAWLVYVTYIGHHDGGGDGEHGGHAVPSIWACIPFVAILGAIAVLPLISSTANWWESNQNRLMVSLLLGGITLVYYAVSQGVSSVTLVLEHAVLAEYVPFIVLLFSLYVISGGISLRGDLAAHPSTNTAFLAVGAGLASFIGTTGASMLLIRPLLQTNRERRHTTHTVIFFIFLVSNIGGLLLPIGDPPLFLGYLRGVPFLWTMKLFVPWLVTSGALLAVYFAFDTYYYKKEAVRDVIRDETQLQPLRMSGGMNFAYLLGVVLCVALLDPSKSFFGLFTPFPLMRELLMLGFVMLSLKTTPSGVREANKFNYHAILEVAALFIGIFICMQVPIAILNHNGAELGLSKPWHFFWATGGLSSFLDNAPTYVVFFETARVLPETGDMVALAGGAGIGTMILEAISLGAVFMGAMTYIGNGPNFMVKSIAEQSGIKMPSFFGYMLWSVAILVPIFVLVSLVFL